MSIKLQIKVKNFNVNSLGKTFSQEFDGINNKTSIQTFLNQLSSTLNLSPDKLGNILGSDLDLFK